MEYYDEFDWNEDKEKSQDDSERKGNEDMIDDMISLVITEDSVYEYDIECLKKNKKYKKY